MRKLLLLMIFAVSSLLNSNAVLGIEKEFTSRLVPSGDETANPFVPGNAEEIVERYFPPGAWGKPHGAWTEAERSQFFEDRFGGQLSAMNERSLAYLDSSEQASSEIRLLFLPTFTHGTMLRLSYDDKRNVSFEFKLLSGAGGYEPGDLIVHLTGTVNEGDASRVFTTLEAIDPWSDATLPVLNDLEHMCADGTQTVLEFRRANAYKVVMRHECALAANDSIRKLIHVFDDISEGQLISPHTFEPLDWLFIPD